MQGDVILHGDVYAALGRVGDGSVKVAITSPPYWKQRDYGFEGQIGAEKTPEGYIGRLLVIFDRLYEKLRDDGVFFLNVGDKYLNRYGKSHLLQIPYRLAYHMVRRGWRLEDVVIWYKPNHMPSSVKDRFTNTYEPIFVFSKGKNNLYRGGRSVVEIPLQQTPWKHTAVYPERLVEEMLRRVELEDGDVILDPFAGTGTTAAVVRRMRRGFYGKRLRSVMIEKGDSFVEIIKERTGIGRVVEVEDVEYGWEPVEELDLPEGDLKLILQSRYGEVHIARSSGEFLSVLGGMASEEFKRFHREDALYFVGVRGWSLDDLYYVHALRGHGYVLRNMIVANNGEGWFPVFMLARDSTRVAYRFYIDRVRTKHRSKSVDGWAKRRFVGMSVRDISGKRTVKGRVVGVLERYDDGFPKLVSVGWDDKVSLEFVMHPERDEFLMEGLRFHCPKCGSELEDPYDPLGDNRCPSCGFGLWRDLRSVPVVREPEEVLNALDSIRSVEMGGAFVGGEAHYGEEQGGRPNSKFLDMDRLNWGASPGARKLVVGEYFTKMRLYRVSQPLVAQYLNILRKAKDMTINDIVKAFPEGYHHTVGHWFRKDFGGSIPIPQDIERLERIFGVRGGLLGALKRTALKFQTVKSSVKGKNPGDYMRVERVGELVSFLKLLFIPSSEYLKHIGGGD
ncbi:MAG: hypothetical protein GXO39_01030 [Thermotogae bacterium]|nr:hypothetical protein [Thermotogota bacterium]